MVETRLPPDLPVNSNGQPFSPTMLNMPADQRARAQESDRQLRAGTFWGPQASPPSQPAAPAAAPTPPPSALPPPSAPAPATVPAAPPPVQTPQARRPQIDPRYWQAIQARDPVIAGWINNASQMFGVSPERLAYHK